ncbi:HTH_48 domain-containing protein [Trichonephila clavata]|uniref:HTH_48 domain-containing protein n=1 Tax=Trichonephila clavata TaxID=2740835 RepID=A0A8X6HW82_TRICU|nr:HTH_48 domain-containing protein [Trichonephila clavata]
MDSAIILHDNARPHKAECVRQLLRRWGWEELEHSQYSPDILPCDFDLIPKIKEPIRGLQHERTLLMLLHKQVKHSGEIADTDGIQRLSLRWQRVVTVEETTLRVFRPRFIMSTLCVLCCHSFAP